VLVTDEVAPGSDGIERGSYIIANGNVTFTRTIDTSINSGFFGPTTPGPTVEQITIVGDTMTLSDQGPPVLTGTRIRPPQ
jgi:hypothetical protein